MNWGRVWATLTTVSQEVQGTGVLCQGTQALDPAAAHTGHAPGCPAEGTCLPKKPQQQLPLLRSKKASGMQREKGFLLVCLSGAVELGVAAHSFNPSTQRQKQVAA